MKTIYFKRLLSLFYQLLGFNTYLLSITNLKLEKGLTIADIYFINITYNHQGIFHLQWENGFLHNFLQIKRVSIKAQLSR